MDQTAQNNPYSTEIPVSQAEQEMHQNPAQIPPPSPLPPKTPSSGPVPPLPPPKRNHHKLLNFVLVALIIILVAWIAILWLGKNTLSQPAQQTAVITPQPKPTSIPTPVIASP
nr:hypothetical protein [Patescibacteria group bacterium]